MTVYFVMAAFRVLARQFSRGASAGGEPHGARRFRSLFTSLSHHLKKQSFRHSLASATDLHNCTMPARNAQQLKGPLVVIRRGSTKNGVASGSSVSLGFCPALWEISICFDRSTTFLLRPDAGPPFPQGTLTLELSVSSRILKQLGALHTLESYKISCRAFRFGDNAAQSQLCERQSRNVGYDTNPNIIIRVCVQKQNFAKRSRLTDTLQNAEIIGT